jgi:LemA protein
MVILIVLLVLFLGVILFAIGIYNTFISLRNQIDEASATMDAYLKNRWELIPNLVETVKGYAAHEKETLERVIQARNQAMGSNSADELQANEAHLMSGLKSLFALSEHYPDLKANTNFLNLQEQLAVVEKDILNSRKYYNAVVRQFNTKLDLFPHVFIAGALQFSPKSYYQIEEKERGSVKIHF